MVKRFDDLTDEQVLALTDDEVARWIDVECAHEGVPLLPPLPVAPPEPSIVPDVTVYELGGFFFASSEDAAKVSALVGTMPRFKLEYTSGPRYEKKAVPTRECEMSSVRVFSPAYWDQVKAEMETYGERKRTYDREHDDYTKAVTARERVTRWVTEKVERTHDEERARQRMRDHLARYIDLAEGDRAVAVKFLLAAYPDAAETLPELAAA